MDDYHQSLGVQVGESMEGGGRYVGGMPIQKEAVYLTETDETGLGEDHDDRQRVDVEHREGDEVEGVENCVDET